MEKPIAKRSYFQDILSYLGSNVTVTISNLVTGIILSRLLGAAGFGLYSYLIVVPIIVIGFTQLGVRRSAIYHIGNKILPEENIVSALFILLLWTSTLSIIICGLAYFFSETQPFDPLIIVLALLTIPLLLSNVFAGGVFLGKEDIRRASILNAGPTLLTLVLTVLFVWVLKLAVLGAFIAIFTANLMTFIYSYRTILYSYHYTITWKYHESIIKSMIKLGLVNALAIFVMQLNYRLDILMLRKLSTLEEVGFYSLAMQIAEQLWHIPMAVENVVLSRSANSQDRSLVHKTVASTFRISLLVGLFLSIGIFFAAPYLIPWIFGEAFVQSVPMIQVVLPGVLILIGFRILNSRLTGMGKPQIAIYTFLPALIINFLLNLFLIPRFGGIGAAWATNVSYAAGSFFFILVYCREVKMSFREIITLRRSDFYFFRDIRSLVKSKK
ncbi:MAG TPA: oligosaccharide flippase family protein [Bacteroidales bacterium]|nr:oligosaccharide flippase family protein [Bacteroidales bacterium]HPT10485.1 oligosaccharide flippase family protein [Bacteroidales bacterium]